MLYCDESARRRPLTLEEYQRRALQSDQNERVGADGLRVPLLGLFGEMGSLLTLPKRKQRETSTYYRVAIVEEFGDVLWYLCNLASRQNIRISALARPVKVDGELRFFNTRASSTLTFRDVQATAAFSLRHSDRVAEMAYFALGGAVGRLMSEFVAAMHSGLDRKEFVQHLGKTFQLLVRAASDAGVDLNFCAHNNLAKIASRWPRVRKYSKPFDATFKHYERLPRHIEMYFEERRVSAKTYVYQTCNQVNIGDRLTDNRVEQDDYRFHDVFHLAYAAILGWSPVMRALFKVKRKSKPAIDENEDGARAILIEEGIATWIFNHGLAHRMFRNVEKLDYSLLKAIRHLTVGYEVEDCPLWQWQEAILEGFRVFRALKKHRKGWVTADLVARTIAFSPHQPRRS